MRIAFLVLPNMLATSLTNAYELFFAAKQAAKMRKMDVAKKVELVKVGATAQRVELPSGLSLLPDSSMKRDLYDIIYVPALWRNPTRVVKSNPGVCKLVA